MVSVLRRLNLLSSKLSSQRISVQNIIRILTSLNFKLLIDLWLKRAF